MIVRTLELENAMPNSPQPEQQNRSIPAWTWFITDPEMTQQDGYHHPPPPSDLQFRRKVTGTTNGIVRLT